MRRLIYYNWSLSNLPITACVKTACEGRVDFCHLTGDVSSTWLSEVKDDIVVLHGRPGSTDCVETLSNEAYESAVGAIVVDISSGRLLGDPRRISLSRRDSLPTTPYRYVIPVPDTIGAGLGRKDSTKRWQDFIDALLDAEALDQIFQPTNCAQSLETKEHFHTLAHILNIGRIPFHSAALAVLCQAYLVLHSHAPGAQAALSRMGWTQLGPDTRRELKDRIEAHSHHYEDTGWWKRALGGTSEDQLTTAIEKELEGHIGAHPNVTELVERLRQGRGIVPDLVSSAYVELCQHRGLAGII